MSVGYTGISWNRQKRRYDAVLGGALLLGFAAFAVVGATARPELTIETVVIRTTAVLAIALLHVILCIGPLARLDRRFLPLLYNRRHLGVTMFLLALIHAVTSIVQFHALSGVNPLLSLFTAYAGDYRPLREGAVNLANFPFEPLGAIALAILFLMAATSHDFWLRQLGPSWWKALHLGVFVAYGLLVGHVAFGALQSERSSVYVGALAAGAAVVLGLHLAAAMREAHGDATRAQIAADGFVRACEASELREKLGKTVSLSGVRIALFRSGGRIWALSNVCRHQGGPLGEGRVVDGCVTCPWHGWQYRPDDGTSPPPFQERIETYRTRVEGGVVYVDPRPCPAGTPQAGAPAPSDTPEQVRGG